MWILRTFLSVMFLAELSGHNETHARQKRYLIFTPSTQWGVFVTVSVPLHPESTVSVAYFFEVNFYTVDNTSYYDPLFSDVTVSRESHKNARSNRNPAAMFSRASLYTYIEDMLQRYGYPGRACILRAICESASAMFPHSGVLGDLLHIILTPSTSISEDSIDDCYYKAEYLGLEEDCEGYERPCPESPLSLFTLLIENLS